MTALKAQNLRGTTDFLLLLLPLFSSPPQGYGPNRASPDLQTMSSNSTVCIYIRICFSSLRISFLHDDLYLLELSELRHCGQPLIYAFHLSELHILSISCPIATSSAYELMLIRK